MNLGDQPPYANDWLFSNFVELLAKVAIHTGKLSDWCLCENACAASDAYDTGSAGYSHGEILKKSQGHAWEYMENVNRT